MMSSSRSSLRERIWEKSARPYDRFERKWHYYGRVSKGLLEPLKIGDDSRVLELATGTGACTVLLSGRIKNDHLVTIEQSTGMVRLARKNLEKATGNNFTVIQGDVSALHKLTRGFGKFDFVVCNAAFWQFTNPEKLVRNIRKLLKPSGVLAFNVPIWYDYRRGESFRRLVQRILTIHGIDANKFFIARRPVNYEQLLMRNDFRTVKRTKYTVGWRRKERDEWKRIPAFAQRWGTFKGLPTKVSTEIREETTRKRLRPWPENRSLKSNWQLILAVK